MSKQNHARLTVMGVSLWNTIYDPFFLKSLHALLEAQRVPKLLVWLADSCEAVNYQVFRGKLPEEAKESAKRRALEMRSMFHRGLEGSGTVIDIVLQSELERRLQSWAKCQHLLEAAYREVLEFRYDVDRQVKENLLHREDEVRSNFIQDRRAELSAYVLSELAVFYALAVQEPYDEIYPGPELFVKRRLFEGVYSVAQLPQLTTIPTFTNISHIVAERMV